jgi:hypothetical protein
MMFTVNYGSGRRSGELPVLLVNAERGKIKDALIWPSQWLVDSRDTFTFLTSRRVFLSDSRIICRLEYVRSILRASGVSEKETMASRAGRWYDLHA